MPRGRKKKVLEPDFESPTFTRDVRVALSPEILRAKAESLAEATLRRNATAEQAKLVAREARAAVKAADAEVAELAAVVATGAETKPVECRTVRHVNAGVVAVVRCDGVPPAEAVVEVRLMTVDEQQLSLGEPLLAEDAALVAEIERRGRELAEQDGAEPFEVENAAGVPSPEDESAKAITDYFAVDREDDGPAAEAPATEAPTTVEPAAERDPWESDDEPEPESAAVASEPATGEPGLFDDLDDGPQADASPLPEPKAAPALALVAPVGKPTPFPISDADDIQVPLEKVKGLGPTAVETLEQAGLRSLRKLRSIDLVDVEALPGIGKKRVLELYAYLEMHYPPAEPEDELEKILPGGTLPGRSAA